MIKKGIILSGGKGTRLGPLTKAVNKQLLPVYDKPLIFYPLSVLMLANIKEVLIIVNPEQKKNFFNILGNGKRYGIKLDYEIQKKPNGLPEAFKIGAKFIGKDNVALILGDNFFYGKGLSDHLKESETFLNGAMIFIKETNNPEKYGIVKLRNKKIFELVEKPKKYISNKAITGIYYFDNKVIRYAKNLIPSKRSETEIVDLLKIYQKNDQLKYQNIGRGTLWSDAGNPDDLSNISNYVCSYEKLELFKIACLEEISFKKGWINKNQIKNNIKFYGPCVYSDYLRKIIK